MMAAKEATDIDLQSSRDVQCHQPTYQSKRASSNRMRVSDVNDRLVA